MMTMQSTACTSCEAGKFTNNKGQPACSPVLPIFACLSFNQRSQLLNCPSRLCSAKQCAVGFFSGKGAQACTACPAGYYQVSLASFLCQSPSLDLRLLG